MGHRREALGKRLGIGARGGIGPGALNSFGNRPEPPTHADLAYPRLPQALFALALPGVAFAQLPPGFRATHTIPVGGGPHGIRFSPDGRLAYVALSADGRIAVVDLERRAVRDRWPAGQAPLDLMPLAGGGWIVTQFRGDRLITVGSSGERWTVGRGPSLFAPAARGDLAYVVSEFADTLTVFNTRSRTIEASHPTGRRPYPADVTPDGALAFVPNRTDGTVSVIDLLNHRLRATVPACANPEGGAVTADGMAYVVACGAANQLAYVSTATFDVVARVADGLGPRPFSVAMTPDGRWGLVNNASGETVSVLDVDARRIVGQLLVGKQPIVIRLHPDARRAYVSNEVSGTLTEIELPSPPPRPDQRSRPESS